MKTIALYLLVLAAATTGGYLLRAHTKPAMPAETLLEPTPPPISATLEPWLEEALQEQSHDTVADVAANRTSTRLPQMTLWLIDASSDEIRELWKTLDEADDLDMRTYDLILIHWTEIDPRAAIAAAKASGQESAAWWAWGHADPEHALKTAMQEAPQFADNVLRAIGQFHVDQAMRLMEQYPEALAHTSIEGIGAGLKRNDPGQAVEFMRTHGQSGHKEFKTWAERDPDAALAWALDNLRSTSSTALKNLVTELVIEHPDHVQGWLQKLPSGGLRKALAKEFVQHLADQDVGQAVAFADTHEGIQIRSELLAAVGQRIAHQDPERSLSLLREAVMDHQKGLKALDVDASDTGPFLPWSENLLSSDPQRVVEATIKIDANREMGLARSMMQHWMDRDEAAYAEWLLTREAGPMRDDGAVLLVSQLRGQRHTNYGRPPDFESAIRWAAAIGDQRQRNDQVQSVVYDWYQRDKTGADAYFQNAGTNTAGKEYYERVKDR